ncbi:MAG: subfamily polymerase sigma factor [Parcubacteria group bacterium]|nr:subfamily polymerase sigma factor [Parcubacteria group bacterium]
MEVSDQETVLAALKDRHAFSVLVDRYEMRLLRYIQRLGIFDIDVAKDILQETFIKVYINLNDYNRTFSFSSWIYRIAHNETLMYFRRQKNRPVPVRSEDGLAIFEQLHDELNLIEESDAKLRSARIGQALEKLKQEYKDILILRFFEEKSYDEISDILQIPSGTVATNISRAKKALGNVLTQEHITDVYYGKDG